MKRLIALAALLLPLGAVAETPGDIAKMMVASHHGRIPMMIEPGLRVDEISSTPEGVFKSTHTFVDESLEDLDPAWIVGLPERTSVLCESDQLKPVLNAGVILEYVFQDRDGKFVARTVLSKASCATR